MAPVAKAFGIKNISAPRSRNIPKASLINIRSPKNSDSPIRILRDDVPPPIYIAGNAGKSFLNSMVTKRSSFVVHDGGLPSTKASKPPLGNLRIAPQLTNQNISNSF